MSQANDSVLVTPGTGAAVATHLVGDKEHQVVMSANANGHLAESLATYVYATPTAPVGSNKLYFDAFNGIGSGVVIEIRGLWIIPKTDAAVTGTLGVRVDFYRTSSPGTGGTAASYKSATADVGGGNVCPLNTANGVPPAQLTARWLPTGGATISEWLFPTYSLGEETATSQAFMTQHQNLILTSTFGQPLTIREGEGVLAKQGTVAATGALGFRVVFTLA